MRVFAVHEGIRRKVDEGEADGRNGNERRRAESEVDGGERGRAGVLLRGSVVKRIDPNHYDMSRLRSAANTMAGSSPESEISPLRALRAVDLRKKRTWTPIHPVVITLNRPLPLSYVTHLGSFTVEPIRNISTAYLFSLGTKSHVRRGRLE